ncbi:hypothetical protein MMC34_005381 [Xylographa carneopallida]|nr:hypothetical protein [Xylographa carneopallida]
MDTLNGLKTHGATIIGTGSAFLALAAISVVLRFLSKRTIKAKPGADDWLALTALAIYTVVVALVIRSTIVGRQANALTDPQYVTYLKLVYVQSIFYWSIIAACMASVLFLYRRIFITSRFRLISLLLVIWSALWLVSGTFVEIFFPSPIPSYWDPNVSGKWLINYDGFWLAAMVLELVTELTILSLPVRQISKLQLSRRKKMLLSFIFLLGGFVIITGIIRIIYVYQPNNSNIDLTQGDVWLNIHSGVAIMSACLPTYRPLLTRGSLFLSSHAQGYNSRASKEELKSMPLPQAMVGADSRDKSSRNLRSSDSMEFDDGRGVTSSETIVEDRELPHHGTYEKHTTEMV